MHSIVTDIKASKWDGESINFFWKFNIPLIVLETYICVCVPFLKKCFTFFNSNGYFNFILRGCHIKLFNIPSIVLEFSTQIWWGSATTFLNIPSIVTGNLESALYTQIIKIIKFIECPLIITGDFKVDLRGYFLYFYKLTFLASQ